MEKKCLVTRLKESVNDNNLFKLGEIRFITESTNEDCSANTVAGKNVEAKILGEGTFKTGVTFKNFTGGKTLGTASTNTTVSIISKYNLQILKIVNARLWNNDLSQLSYCPISELELRRDVGLSQVYVSLKALVDIIKTFTSNNFSLYVAHSFVSTGNIKELDAVVNKCTKLTLYRSHATGSIDDLHFTPLTTVLIIHDHQNNRLVGDIANLASGYNLTKIALGATNISGDINTLLNRMHQNGRSSGNINITVGNGGITYNGSILSSGTTKNFTFTSSGWQEAN